MQLRTLIGLTCLLSTASFNTLRAQPPAAPNAAPFCIHVGGEFRRLTRDICALKAMEVMALKEKFIVAAIDPDGNAWGRNEHVVVRVFTLPYQDGVNVLVVAAGDNKEAQRVGNAIRTHVFDGDLDAKTPRKFQTKDTTRTPCNLVLRWSWEQRNLLPTVRHFQPAAALVMEKHGLATNPAGGLIFGGNPKAAVAALVCRGPNEVNIQIGAISVSTEENEAERLHNVVRAGIAKVLFD